MRNITSRLIVASLIVVAGPVAAQSAPPPVPQIAWMPLTYTAGQSFALTWDLWWVNPSQAPTRWQVLRSGTSIQNSTTFAVASPKVAGPWKGVTSLSIATAGTYDLTVKTCNLSGCSTSASKRVTITAPKPPTSTPPLAPVIASMPTSYKVGATASLTWNIGWTEPAKAPSRWRVLVDTREAVASTAFSVSSPGAPGAWQGTAQFTLSDPAGAHALTVEACNTAGCTRSAPYAISLTAVTTPLGAEPTSVAGSVKAVQTRRAYVGYYPSWSDPWFSATDASGAALTDDQILVRSKFARIPATYTHVNVSFADPNFTWNGDMSSWAGTGLGFTARPSDIKRAIDVLHARNLKVLLAVGGATYGNWTALAAEGNAGVAGPITQSLTKMLTALGFDGLDVDYEVAGADAANVTRYRGAINAMRRAVDAAGGGRILTLAAWSTGADCTAATATVPCGNAISYWGGSAGRERLLFSDATTAAKLDMVSVMSYDARYERYDGRVAWNLYRELLPAKTIVNIGFQPAPEGWAGAQLVINDADAGCTGSVVLLDQFSKAVNKPYSVQRLASVPMASTSTKANPRDGAMLWEILKTATGTCGAAPLASPSTIAGKLNQVYGLPADPRDAWK